MGFSGRLEAIRAPTSGKTKKSPEPSKPTVVRSASQLLGTCAERASTSSGTPATNMATHRPHNDHASQEATRALDPPVRRAGSRRVVLSVTTPPYKMIVSQSLRQTLRAGGFRETLSAPPTTRTWWRPQGCGDAGAQAISLISVLTVHTALTPSQRSLRACLTASVSFLMVRAGETVKAILVAVFRIHALTSRTARTIPRRNGSSGTCGRRPSGMW
jgi:hypothetical protein